MEIDNIDKENSKNSNNFTVKFHNNKNKMKVNNYNDIMDEDDNIMNYSNTKNTIVNNIIPSIIKYFKYHNHTKENKLDDMDIEYKVHNSINENLTT